VTRYRSVVLDVDSTLAGIEGIDWLAARRGPTVAAESLALTSRAMAGEISIESVYGLRMEAVRPTAAELAALGEAYREAAAPGARECITSLRAAGVEVHAVSGGIRQSILPFAAWLGLDEARVHAVSVFTDPQGAYTGWETTSPLATSAGKPAVVRALALPTPLLAVGDGATDLAIRGAGATFAAFTGFVTRGPVVAQADLVIESFPQLTALVLP
jgi:phosphoserine phosphatase